jgi:hypothetical protein
VGAGLHQRGRPALPGRPVDVQLQRRAALDPGSGRRPCESTVSAWPPSVRESRTGPESGCSGPRRPGSPCPAECIPVSHHAQVTETIFRHCDGKNSWSPNWPRGLERRTGMLWRAPTATAYHYGDGLGNRGLDVSCSHGQQRVTYRKLCCRFRGAASGRPVINRGHFSPARAQPDDSLAVRGAFSREGEFSYARAVAPPVDVRSLCCCQPGAGGAERRPSCCGSGRQISRRPHLRRPGQPVRCRRYPLTSAAAPAVRLV